LHDALVAAGRACTVIPAVGTDSNSADTAASMARTLASVAADGALRVIDCRPLDAPPPSDLTSGAAVERAAEDLSVELAQLVKAATAASSDCAVHLTTQGAVAVGGESPDGVVQAPVWGIAKVIGLEHPELRTRVIDLEPGADSAAAAAATILDDRGEPQIAIRRGRRLVPRLVPYTAAARAERLSLDRDRGWLISGGLGGLGLLVARRLVERGAGPIVLFGRRPPSPAARTAHADLQLRGATVIVQRADVADEAQVVAAVQAVRGAGARIGGVIHAAGLLDDGIVLQLTRERFARVLKPKVQGAWNLHTATLAEPV